MKFLKLITTMLLFPSAAFAGEWNYDLSAEAQGLYGYSDVKEHHHGIGKGKLKNTLTYSFDEETNAEAHIDFIGGLNRELQNENQGRWGEEVYGIFESAYGQIMAGQAENVASLFHNGAPKAGAMQSNADVVDFIANPNWKRTSKETKFTTLTSTDINTDGVAAKISYVSPEIYGTAVGFSYMPDAYNRKGLINKHAGYAHKDGFVGAVYSDQDWGFFESKASFGYAQYQGNSKEFSYGLNLSRGNWTIGGGFRKSYIDGENKSTPNRILPEDFDGYREGYAWNVGAGYEIGPFSSALTYFESKAKNVGNENKIISFSNEYQFNKNLNIYAAAIYADYDNVAEDKKGYAVAAGIGVKF